MQLLNAVGGELQVFTGEEGPKEKNKNEDTFESTGPEEPNPNQQN